MYCLLRASESNQYQAAALKKNKQTVGYVIEGATAG